MTAKSMKQNAKTKSETGFILISVLLMISVLAAFILEFNYDARIRLRVADSFNLAACALNNADAGVALATAALGKSENSRRDETAQPFLAGLVQVPLEDGFCKVSVARESGKININALCDSSGKPIRRRMDQMLRLIDLLNRRYEEKSLISYSLVPSIIDWMDSDNDVTVLPFAQGQNCGAENDYYEKLDDPYKCPNESFEVLSELLSVKGMTSEIYYGTKANEVRSTKAVPGISQFLTVYGDGKININEAPIIIIESLSERISEPLARNIVERRKFSRYSNIEQLKTVPGMTGEIYEQIHDLITVEANGGYYSVTSTGVVKGMERTVRAVLRENPSTSRLEVVMRSETNM